MSLIYIDLVPIGIRTAFENEVKNIAAKLGTNPNFLMQVMHAESKVRASAVNSTSGASGLIQFMPATAAGLGTSVYAIRNMNALEQLPLVYKYFLPYKNKLHSYYDVYFAVFYPAAIGRPDTWILQSSRVSAAVIAKQNPSVNINKDNKITVAEFKQYVRNTVHKNNIKIIFDDIKKNVPFVAILFLLKLVVG